MKIGRTAWGSIWRGVWWNIDLLRPFENGERVTALVCDSISINWAVWPNIHVREYIRDGREDR